MRKQLCDALVARSGNPDMLFLTGDLGFMALEDLQSAMQSRFINAGVAEQNMVSVAAALAKQDFEVWAYSIAPFCYARPFEQIRNDVCFHELPVKILANGGGYGYGVMGATHHAIEDYGIMLTLPHMTAFVPAFDEDVGAVVDRAGGNGLPSYLRLGRGEPPADWEVPAYAPWRELVHGEGPDVVIAVGPLAGTYVSLVSAMPDSERPSLWAVCELPIGSNPVPETLLRQIERARAVVVAEEHVAHGGFASELALNLMLAGVTVSQMKHLCARQHTFDRYGSQSYLRRATGLDPATLQSVLQGVR